MLQFVLSGIAALLLLSTGIIALFKQRAADAVIFFFLVLLLAGIELVDDMFQVVNVDFDVFRQITLAFESLLPAAFLILTLNYSRRRPFETSAAKARLPVNMVLSLMPMIILLTAGSSLYFSPDFLTDKVLFLENSGYWFYLLIMLSLIFSLVNIEETLAAADGINRYRIKFEIFGFMALLGVLIFYYSQALLYRTINMSLSPVRSGVFIIASLLIGYSQAFRGTARVSVSRHIFYRSVTLLVVGIYLITLALIGEGMRYFGVTFARDLTIVLAFGGGLLVLAVLFSEKARRTARVYIQKHFYGDKHDYRAEWIRLTERLSKCSGIEDIQEGILAAYLNTFGFAGGALYLRTGNEKQYLPDLAQNMPNVASPLFLSDNVKAYFLSTERVLNPADREGPLSPQEADQFIQCQAFLVVPLIANGRIEGLLTFREQLVNRLLIYDDYDLMKVMARQAAHAIANFLLGEEVVEMKTMAGVAKISSFVIHDLKNLTTSLSLVVDNSGLHMGNPAFQKDAIKTIGNTVMKMQSLIQRLKAIPEKTALVTVAEDVQGLVHEVVQEFRARKNAPRIVYAGSPVLCLLDREEMRKVFVNLIQNAIEVTDHHGTIEVKTNEENGNALISVSDNGIGMEENFVKNQLFRPFKTTKLKGLGIGLYQSRQIVEAHGGRIEVKSEVKNGTTFTVVLPLAATTGVTV